jgi:hypothetical protein
MLVIGGLLNVVGLGFFCWVLFTLAIDVAGFRWRHSGGSIQFKLEQDHSAPSWLVHRGY